MTPDNEIPDVAKLYQEHDFSPPLSSFLLQDAGIWFVFHSASTGSSHGLVPETKAELTPLGIFYNNRVHSNFKVSSHEIISCFYFIIVVSVQLVLSLP